MRYYNDLRSFIAALDEMGDIMHVTREVDCDFEPSAITRRSYEIQSPAPLFHNVAGVASGFRLFGAPASLSSRAEMPYARVAMSLGLNPASSGPDIVEALSAARHKPGIPPVRVDSADAPCQQIFCAAMMPASTASLSPSPTTRTADVTPTPGVR